MPIYKNIENGKYKNTKEYPIRAYYKNLIGHGVDRMDEYKQKLDEWGTEEGRLTELFWSDVEEEFGTANHALQYSLRAYAYQQGHSGGFYDIYSVYSDLYYHFIEMPKEKGK